MRRLIRVHAGWLAVLLALGSGCATGERLTPAEPTVAPLSMGKADIVFVRAKERYVIIRGERLPNAGHEAKVYRDETPVGTVRFTEPRQGGYAAADIVEGVLLPGDRVLR